MKQSVIYLIYYVIKNIISNNMVTYDKKRKIEANVENVIIQCLS